MLTLINSLVIFAGYFTEITFMLMDAGANVSAKNSQGRINVLISNLIR